MTPLVLRQTCFHPKGHNSVQKDTAAKIFAAVNQLLLNSAQTLQQEAFERGLERERIFWQLWLWRRSSNSIERTQLAIQRCWHLLRTFSLISQTAVVPSPSVKALSWQSGEEVMLQVQSLKQQPWNYHKIERSCGWQWFPSDCLKGVLWQCLAALMARSIWPFPTSSIAASSPPKRQPAAILIITIVPPASHSTMHSSTEYYHCIG